MADDTDADLTGVHEGETIVPAAVAGIGATVERWIVEELHGSIVTRDTEAWNFLRTKLLALQALLEQEHGQ